MPVEDNSLAVASLYLCSLTSLALNEVDSLSYYFDHLIESLNCCNVLYLTIATSSILVDKFKKYS